MKNARLEVGLGLGSYMHNVWAHFRAAAQTQYKTYLRGKKNLCYHSTSLCALNSVFTDTSLLEIPALFWPNNTKKYFIPKFMFD